MPSIAKTVVTECLRAKPGEAVTVSTYPHTIDAANEIATELYRAGAEPLLLLDTDEFFYAQFKHLTEDQLKTPSPHCLGLTDYVNANIYLGGPKDPSGMRRIPSSKWNAYNEGEIAHYEKSLQKKTRSLYLPLGTITRERAKTYGFNYNTWRKSFTEGLKVKYADLQTTGKRLGALLALPQSVRITAPNGTNLRFQLARREAQVNDGIIDEEDIMAGANDASLPAGSVTVAPQEDSASGVLVGDVPIPLQGKLLEGLAFRFENGRVTEISGKRNANLITEQYAAGTGADHGAVRGRHGGQGPDRVALDRPEPQAQAGLPDELLRRRRRERRGRGQPRARRDEQEQLGLLHPGSERDPQGRGQDNRRGREDRGLNGGVPAFTPAAVGAAAGGTASGLPLAPREAAGPLREEPTAASPLAGSARGLPGAFGS